MESEMDNPDSALEIWSPGVMYSSHPHCSGSRITSTPYWPLSSKKLDDSAGSTKQDSGYCSMTPRSADSGVLSFGKCLHCDKSFHHSYTPGITSYLCTCKNPHIDVGSPNSECMGTIQEVKISLSPKLTSRVRLNRPLELYEDAVDTSLYSEEMEIGNSSSGENHQCSFEFLELDEEKSIDFMESQVCSASQGPSKDITSICSLSNVPTEVVNFEDCNSQSSEKKVGKFSKTDSEKFFTPEISNIDLVSPKIKNESTPTKIKRRTSPTKMKRGSAFQSSAKKVVTINRVLKSFFSLNGIESVDFLYQLGVKLNCQQVVSKIFSFLTEEDLDAVRVVSKTWNKLLYNDFAAFNRWQLHSTAIRLMKENMSSPIKQGGSGGRTRPALVRLQNVGNNQTSPSRQPLSPQQPPLSPPISPDSARFRSYQRAIKSLKKDERVLPCPKCRFASTDRGNPVAECPRSGCRHSFCVWCSNEVHPDKVHTCPPLYTPRPLTRRNTTEHSVGSKISKRNLRRLL